MLAKFKSPNAEVWKTFPPFDTPIPSSPFDNEILKKIYYTSMNVTTPLTIAIIYFTSVHFINSIIRNKQIVKYNKTKTETTTKIDITKLEDKKLQKILPTVPNPIAKTSIFKIFVLLHNILLCLYSVWTFLGILHTITTTMNLFEGNFFQSLVNSNNYQPKKLDSFIHSVCDPKIGIFSRLLTNEQGLHNLEIFGWWFYISKFYEVLDTVIILLKGRPSSLLQSYHHAGAMMCMWAGIRYQSPPIWIFVVFNSFIHSLMYFYFSLSCLKITVPNFFKRILTTMQITQFIVGGSIAILHSFVWIVDTSHVINPDNLKWVSCISTPDQALPILINVLYLLPLTALFTAFYIESYLKKKSA